MGLRRESRGPVDLPEVRYESGMDGEEPLETTSAASGWLLVLGLAIGMFLLWLVSGLASGGAERAQPVAVATATAPVLVVPSPVPTPTPSPVPTPTPPPVTFVDARAAQIAWSQLSTAGPRHAVAYTTDAGLGVLEFSSRVVGQLEPRADRVGGPLVLGSDAPPVMFGPGQLGLLHRVASGLPAATGAEKGTIVHVSTDGTELVVVDSSTGSVLGSSAVPEGGELRPLDGYGVVVHIDGEGSWVVGSEGRRLMTTGELLTGNGVAWLERRCSGVCEVVLVERVGGDEHVLPESFAAEDSRYLISPDGVYVLRVTTEGSGELYLPESGAVWWVNGSGIGQAAWAPDSTFVAWIDDSGDPLLKLMLPQRHDWIVVDLGLLGAAPPVDGELHVVLSE